MSYKTVAHPLMKYNPGHYIPIDLIRQQWEYSKISGLDRINAYDEEKGGLISMISPFVFSISVFVFLPTALAGRESLAHYLSSPLTCIMLLLFIVSGWHFYKRIKNATVEREAADYAVLESTRQYIQNRYGFTPKGWEERLISYLVNEPVKDDRFSEEYKLSVRNFKGHPVIMVTNINGEAPLNPKL